MKIIIIAITLLALAGTASADAQAGDILKFDGQTLEIPVFPLEDYKPIAEGKIKLMIKPCSISSAHLRGYSATWEIADGKLWLVSIEGWIEDLDYFSKKVKRETLESGVQTGVHFSSKDFYKKATLEEIFVGQLQNGRVHATWFSGRLFYPGFRWGTKFNPAEKEKQESKASLVITIKDGIVTQIENRKTSQSGRGK